MLSLARPPGGGDELAPHRAALGTRDGVCARMLQKFAHTRIGDAMKSRIMNFRIDPTLYRAVQIVAQKRNLTVSAYVRDLVCRALLKELEKGEGAEEIALGR